VVTGINFILVSLAIFCIVFLSLPMTSFNRGLWTKTTLTPFFF